MFNNWIDPIIFHLGPFALHWYGLMYALTFIIAYLFLQYSRKGKELELDSNQKDNFLIAAILGIIIGSRLGYVLLYNFNFYLANPLKIFALWEGGLSFHGGLIGTVLVIWLFTKYYKVSFLKIGDLAALITPIGIFLGRIGNFINAELYGRVANSFCLYFPTDPQNCRYPSQLFEAATEGLLTFILLYWYSRRYPQARPGILGAAFLILYSLARISMEFFRQPDPQIGFLWGGATLGQILSVFLLISGLIMFIYLNRSSEKNSVGPL